jgi:hypothetical protein
MGMYDIVKVLPEILPISELERTKIAAEKTEWQTKDFDKCLTNLEITPDGRLTETIQDESIDLDFHGIFEFHSSVGNQWYSFLAKYTDGKLVKIIKISESLKYDWPQIPLNHYFKDEKKDSK